MMSKYKKLFGILLVVLMAVFLAPGVTKSAHAVSAEGDAVIAFTSDVHNEPAGEAAGRLGNWIDTVNTYTGGSGIDFLTFCGDMGKSSGEQVSGTLTGDYWSWTKAAMDAAEQKLGSSKVAYTTGNHELNPNDGGFDPAATYSDDTRSRFSIDKVVKQDSRYEVYCMGSTSHRQKEDGYSDAQISKLDTYLKGIPAGSSKIYFIATHYPLHSFRGYELRTTKNAYSVISKINTAAESKNVKIVLIWGHNHSVNDTNYNRIYYPGESFLYDGTNSATIQFFYVPAGCMSDSENTSGNAGNIAPKGLMCRIASDGTGSFGLFNKNGNLIGNKETPMTVPVTTYTVQYDKNGATGGTVPTDQNEYQSGGTVTVSGNTGNLTLAGYTFGGWSDGSTIYQAGSTFTINGNKTLKAVWNANTYTVKYEGNGGTGTMLQQSFTYGKEQKLRKNTFIYLNHSFTGWKDASGRTYTDEQSVKNLTEVNGATVTLTAQWKDANKYTVTYQANDADSGTAPEDTKQYTILSEVTVLGNTGNLGRTGYAFTGWKRAGSQTLLHQGDHFTIASDEVLTAVWEANRYTVRFDAGGGSGQMSDQEFTYGTKAALRKNQFRKEGVSFAGWKDEETGKTYTDEQPVENLTAVNGKIITLKAQWSSGKIRVTSVTLDQKTLTLEEGGSAVLKATALPSNATDKTINWASGNEAVASVDSNGCVHAVKEGTAVITARSAENPIQYAQCRVTVNKKQEETGSTNEPVPTAPNYAALIQKVRNSTVTIKSAKAKKKKMTVKWNPDPSTYNGYQVSYRIKNKKWKTITVSNASAGTRVIKKLKKGKKYQIMIRGYRQVSNQTVYGRYSKMKTVKIK